MNGYVQWAHRIQKRLVHQSDYLRLTCSRSLLEFRAILEKDLIKTVLPGSSRVASMPSNS